MDKDVKALAGWRCVFLANGFTGVPQPSGGTTHFAEVATHWLDDGLDVSIQTCAIGVENLKMEGYPGRFVLAPLDWGSSRTLLGWLLMYGTRMVSVPFVLPWRSPWVLLYGTSDLFVDTIPCFLAKVSRRRRFRWVNCVWHLLPEPSLRQGSRLVNTLAFLAQKFSLALIKAAADLVLVDNAVLKEQLVALGFLPESVYVTSMGVDLPPAPSTDDRLYDACYMGRLHPSKGIYELVDVWKKVSEAHPGARLAVVGTGREEFVEEFEARIERAGLKDAVDVMGYLPREKLHEVLYSSKVFVFPSHEEGFGISLLEGMAHGLPAVAFELPHYHEVFGNTLQTVPMGDVESMAATLTGLLGDEGRRAELAEQGRILGEKYTWRSVARREAEAIARVVEGIGAERGAPDG
ncbi:MAG: glycosyltransferase [Actinomycetota bacterium]